MRTLKILSFVCLCLFALQINVVAQSDSPVLTSSGRIANPFLADLVVSDFQAVGSPSTSSSAKGYVGIPVSVTVHNKGKAIAGTFNIGAQMFHSKVKTGMEVKFSTPIVKGLKGGQSITRKGMIYVSTKFVGQKVGLQMMADACYTKLPGACQVKESNETNNHSKKIGVLIPKLPISTPKTTTTSTTPTKRPHPFVLMNR